MPSASQPSSSFTDFLAAASLGVFVNHEGQGALIREPCLPLCVSVMSMNLHWSVFRIRSFFFLGVLFRGMQVPVLFLIVQMCGGRHCSGGKALVVSGGLAGWICLNRGCSFS
jgi:hypothetical protein